MPKNPQTARKGQAQEGLARKGLARKGLARRLAVLLATGIASVAPARMLDLTAVQRDIAGAPAGTLTWDLLTDFEGQLFGQQMVLQLDSGSVFFDGYGAETAPQHSYLGLSASLEADTFLTLGGPTAGESADVLVVGRSTEFDQSFGERRFDSSGIDMAWAPAPGVRIFDQTDFMTARVTLSDDASGTLHYFGNGTIWSLSQPFENGWLGDFELVETYAVHPAIPRQPSTPSDPVTPPAPPTIPEPPVVTPPVEPVDPVDPPVVAPPVASVPDPVDPVITPVTPVLLPETVIDIADVIDQINVVTMPIDYLPFDGVAWYERQLGPSLDLTIEPSVLQQTILQDLEIPNILQIDTVNTVFDVAVTNAYDLDLSGVLTVASVSPVSFSAGATNVPEPTSALLLLSGLSLAAARPRRA